MDGAYLPFADDTFDLILAFHSLEHVADLMATMREVWRIGRPGAQVVIAAPYLTLQLNLANPYHLQAFNEHTPRFWTNARNCGLDPVEWRQPPLGEAWGLASSDMSDPGLDLRTVRIEFFYLAEYWGLSPEALRAARSSRLDVCEQVLYHLIVFKPPLREEEVEERARDLYMPPRLEERRQAARRASGTAVRRYLSRWRSRHS